MATKLSLPDVPRSTMFTKDGKMETVWQEFFRDLFIRVGGANTLSNSEIVEVIGYSGLTPLRIISTTIDSRFTVIEDLTDWIKTASVNKITVTDLGDGTLQLSLPDSIELSGATGSRLLSTDAANKTESVANLSSWVGGTANKISVTDDGDGSITLSIPAGAVITFGNSGISIQDTDASNVLSVVAGSNLTADRNLTITTGDSDRIVTLSGNPTLDDWFDQAVKTTSSPTFDDLTLTGSASLDDGEKIVLGTDGDSSISDSGSLMLINPDELSTGARVLRVGDGTNYTEIQNDGTQVLVGTAHKKYGSMYGDDISVTVAVASSMTYYEVGSGFSDGGSQGFTFQNAKELKCLVAGKYLINWSMTVETAAAAQYIEGAPMINGAEQLNAVGATEVPTANKKDHISGTGIFTLAVDDLVSLAVDNETSTQDIVVDHANLTLMQVGG